MLHQPAPLVAVDMIGRSILSAAAVVALLSTIAIDARAAGALEGRRCFKSELAINNNLPLSATSPETDIRRIEGIYVPAVHRVVGWLYTTRGGSAFVQVGAKDDVAEVFRSVGADDLAAVVTKSRPFAYYRLPVAAAKEIRAKPSIVLASCYGTGK